MKKIFIITILATSFCYGDISFYVGGSVPSDNWFNVDYEDEYTIGIYSDDALMFTFDLTCGYGSALFRLYDGSSDIIPVDALQFMEQPVPEPVSLFLLGAGVVFLRRRLLSIV